MKVCYEFEWKAQGTVTLTADGRPQLPQLPKAPGIYRMTLTKERGSSVYIGEAEDLKRRSYNYRNPGPSQQTSLRINDLLRRELAVGTRIEVATVVNPSLEIDGRAVTVDWKRKPYRLLFENAALVAVADEGIQEMHNL